MGQEDKKTLFYSLCCVVVAIAVAALFLAVVPDSATTAGVITQAPVRPSDQ